jgi:membrane protease YdiL (CAAX protease family)
MAQTETGGPSFGEARFALKPGPIALTLLLAVAIPFLSLATVEFAKSIVKLPERPQMLWMTYYYHHIAQLGYALLAIYLLRLIRPDDYGLHRPEGKSYLGVAILCGLLFGAIMTAVDYWPEIAAAKPPGGDQPIPLTWLNIVGWFTYQGVFAGISNEVFFRGLLLTFLTQRMPGRIAWGGFAMNGAGLVVAVIYALSYSETFLSRPFLVALGQLVYAFAFGVVYAVWREKSRSVLPSIVGQNVSNALETIFIFVMEAAWR